MPYAIWGTVITVGLMFVVLTAAEPIRFYALALQISSLIGQLVSMYFFWKRGWV